MAQLFTIWDEESETLQGKLQDVNWAVHTSKYFCTSTSEFARGLKDFRFQLINPVSATICKHTTVQGSKQVPSPSIDINCREPWKKAYLCSRAGPLPTGTQATGQSCKDAAPKPHA